MVKAYPELYKRGAPSISSQGDPAISEVYSNSTELFQLSLARLQAITTERNDDKLTEAFQSLVNWLETGKQITDND